MKKNKADGDRQRAPQVGAQRRLANFDSLLANVDVLNLAVIGGALASSATVYPNPILKSIALACLAEISARLTGDDPTDFQLSLAQVSIDEIAGATAMILKMKVSYTADDSALSLLNSLADSLTAEFQERINREKLLAQSAKFGGQTYG